MPFTHHLNLYPPPPISRKKYSFYPISQELVANCLGKIHFPGLSREISPRQTIQKLSHIPHENKNTYAAPDAGGEADHKHHQVLSLSRLIL